MNNLQIKKSSSVQLVFDQYPDMVQEKMINLRRLVLETATESEAILNLEETLKWGEPSYLSKYGSTLRMDWKKNKPEQYAMYFKCTSLLVPTFKKVYGNLFKYENDRAIVFELSDAVPEPELKKCIAACLTYHKAKKIPLLGLALS